MRITKILPSALCLAALITGCVHTRTMDELTERAAQTPPPQSVHRSLLDSSSDFGKMVLAYTGQALPIIIEVDLIPKNSGVLKELPNDLGGFVNAVVLSIGEPFATSKTYDSIILHETPASLGFSTQARSSRPTPTIKLRGELLAATENVIRSREIKGGILGHISSRELDGELGAAGKVVIRTLKVALYLTDLAGTSVNGPPAIFEVKYRNDEDSANVSLYYDGSGAGISSTVQINQDIGNVIFDVTSAAVMKLIGHWLLVPYYRCSSIFPVDGELEQRLRSQLSRNTAAELETAMKRYLFAAGFAMDMTAPSPTQLDRFVMNSEMARAGLNLDSLNDKVEFIIARWKTLDYHKAALRMTEQINSNTRAMREYLASNAASSSAKDTQPSETPHPKITKGETKLNPQDQISGTSVVQIDLSRISDVNSRDSILNAIQHMPGCHELRIDQSLWIAGLRLHGKPIDLQRTLRRLELPGLNYVWNDNSYGALVVMPLK